MYVCMYVCMYVFGQLIRENLFGWGWKIHRLHLINVCPVYDIQQSDVEALVMLEI